MTFNYQLLKLSAQRAKWAYDFFPEDHRLVVDLSESVRTVLGTHAILFTQLFTTNLRINPIFRFLNSDRHNRTEKYILTTITLCICIFVCLSYPKLEQTTGYKTSGSCFESKTMFMFLLSSYFKKYIYFLDFK